MSSGYDARVACQLKTLSDRDPMEDDDAADASGLLMRMDVPSLHAGAERFVAMAKALVKRVLDHYRNAAFEEINILQPDATSIQSAPSARAREPARARGDRAHARATTLVRARSTG